MPPKSFSKESSTFKLLLIILLFEILTSLTAINISDQFGKCPVKSSYKANNSLVYLTINLPNKKHGECIAIKFYENVNYALVFISTNSSDIRAGFLDVGVFEDMWDEDIVFKHDVRFDPERHLDFTIGFPSIQNYPIIVKYIEKIFDPNHYVTFNVTILPAYEIDQKTSRCPNNTVKIIESLHTDSRSKVPMCFNCNLTELLNSTETESLQQQKLSEFLNIISNSSSCRDGETGSEKIKTVVIWGLVLAILLSISVLIIFLVVICKRIMKAIRSHKSKSARERKYPLDDLVNDGPTEGDIFKESCSVSVTESFESYHDAKEQEPLKPLAHGPDKFDNNHGK